MIIVIIRILDQNFVIFLLRAHGRTREENQVPVANHAAVLHGNNIMLFFIHAFVLRAHDRTRSHDRRREESQFPEAKPPGACVVK